MAVPSQLTSQKLEENPLLPIDSQQNLVYTLTRLFRIIAQIVNPVVAWAQSFVDAGISWARTAQGTSALYITGSGTAPQGGAALVLDKTAPANGNVCSVQGKTGGVLRWQIQPGNGSPETGGNAGSDFAIYRYNDAGALMDAPLTVYRASGEVIATAPIRTLGQIIEVSGNPSALLSLNKAAGTTNNYAYIQAATAGKMRWQMFLGNSAAETGGSAGSDFSLINFNDAGGYLGIPITIARNTGITTFQQVYDGGYSASFYGGGTVGGGIRIGGPGGGRVIRGGGTANAGLLEVINNANSAVIFALADSGRFTTNMGWGCKRGGSGAQGGNTNNFYWNGNSHEVWIDDYHPGDLAYASDERLKHNIEPLDQQHDAFMQIAPISFRWQDIGIWEDDGRTRWGFSAQNLATCVPKAVTGDVNAIVHKADGDHPQPAGVDDRTLIALTVLEVQALWERISTLETQVANLQPH